MSPSLNRPGRTARSAPPRQRAHLDPRPGVAPRSARTRTHPPSPGSQAPRPVPGRNSRATASAAGPGRRGWQPDRSSPAAPSPALTGPSRMAGAVLRAAPRACPVQCAALGATGEGNRASLPPGLSAYCPLGRHRKSALADAERSTLARSGNRSERASYHLPSPAAEPGRRSPPGAAGSMNVIRSGPYSASDHCQPARPPAPGSLARVEMSTSLAAAATKTPDGGISDSPQ